MFHAGHRIDQRIQQTGEIVSGLGVKKWWKPMAAALGVKPGDLDGFIYQARQSDEWTAEIDRLLADLLIMKADNELTNGTPFYTSPKGFIPDLLNLADQYLSLHRERPLIPPGAERGADDLIIEEVDDIPRASLDDMSHIPVELRDTWKELLADE
jgi:hypothetical protein